MNPPPLPLAQKRKSRVWMILVAIGVLVVSAVVYGGFQVFRFISESGVAANFDQQFGDQHIKTAVALIELHKLRTGRYPEDLGKLRYTGQWDMLALQSVRYVVAGDGSSYFVEVERGWIGKPKLVMPEDFWQGTGYNPKLAESQKEKEPNQALQPTAPSGRG
jgi:hypothetical protein